MTVKDLTNPVKSAEPKLVTCRNKLDGKAELVSNTLMESIAIMRKDEVDIDALLLQTVGLSSKSEQILDNLSQGMRQRLSLACALIGNPKC